jgi:hypothetical protein
MTKAVAERPAPGGYEVGYGKPPKDRQFRKGQSGNPGGRPRARPPIDIAPEGHHPRPAGNSAWERASRAARLTPPLDRRTIDPDHLGYPG